MYRCSADGDGVKLTYGGIATLLIDDGQTQILADGFFTRRYGSAAAILNQAISPDAQAVSDGLAAMGVDQLDALVIGHTHYDHALDAGLILQQTSAQLYASRSGVNIARGAGTDDARLTAVTTRKPYHVGAFVLRFHTSRHMPYPYGLKRGGGVIEAPLVPPVPLWDYRVGETLAIEISHAEHGSLMLLSSAGFIDGMLEGEAADIILLGVGGLGRKPPSYIERYLDETIAPLKPRLVIPIHFEGLTSPLSGGALLPPLADDFSHTLARIRQRNIPTARLDYLTPTKVLRDGRLGCG